MNTSTPIKKLTTGIPGFDLIAAGGLPHGRTTLVTGSAGSAKTIFSRFTDSIIMLRYVEMFGEMHRSLMVLKMRGSMHDKEIREYTIDEGGMHIGKSFRGVTGILSGRPQYIVPAESERLGDLFQEPATRPVQVSP